MQIKNKVTLMYPLSVLVFGLISCSPEKQPSTKDSVKIQEPEIVTENGLSTKVSNMDANFIWTPKDRIRFQDSNRDGLKLTIKSSCSTEKAAQVYEESQIRALPSELPVATLLPVSLLTRKNPLQESRFSCSFSFSVMNDKGSQHNFKLPARWLTEQPLMNYQTVLQVSGATVETKPNEWPEIDSANLGKYWVSSPHANQFQLSCTDLQLRATSRADLVPISEIINRQDAEKVYLSKQKAPIQACRIVTFNNGILNGWSSFFKINWLDSKIDIAATRLLERKYVLHELFAKTLILYKVKIKNSYTFPIYFSIPDQKDIWVFAMKSNDAGFKYKQPFSIEFDRATPGMFLDEKKPNRIGLSPGAAVTLMLQSRITRVCYTGIIGFAYPFRSMANLKIKRYLNMMDDTEVGSQDLVPREIIGTEADNVSGWNPNFSDSYDPNAC